MALLTSRPLIKSSTNFGLPSFLPVFNCLCMIANQVQETPQHSDKMAGVRSLNVEFSREALDTMLDGLGKIRNQLSSVAK